LSLHDLATGGLRLLDPETAHRATIAFLKAGLGPRPDIPAQPRLAVRAGGLDLPCAIGLAAGFDKDAEAPDAVLAMGFGFVECGAVTPMPQAGNPRPRLFRLSEDRGVINRMGFNNQGQETFAARLAARPRRGVVGVNIGANKDSADRTQDYVTVLTRLWNLADYFTVNVSSPNTPGLRALQTREALEDLLTRLGAARASLTAKSGARPVWLKVAPDLEEGEIEAVVESAIVHRLDAIVVGNTTLSRPETLKSDLKAEAGGLSGPPLMALSTRALGRFYKAAAGRIALVGAGGIASGADAYAKVRAGASAVQLYSAMVYQGPGLVPRVRRELDALLAADGFSSLAQAVGAAHG
jgi:dihydroorotate dehydrogenase